MQGQQSYCADDGQWEEECGDEEESRCRKMRQARESWASHRTVARVFEASSAGAAHIDGHVSMSIIAPQFLECHNCMGRRITAAMDIECMK